MQHKKEKIVVGLNEYVTDEKIEIPAFKIDPSVEKRALERLKKFKESRDEEKVSRALRALRAAAEEEGKLIPALIVGSLFGCLKVF